MSSFPSGFRWGGATASYQIEGAVHAAGRGPSIWDTFSHTPGRIHDGDTGDEAIDHYHRYREDVALMARLGLNTYRFSIAWPRIQPDGAGPALAEGLDFYQRLVDELREHDIDPWITLYHWDLPQALEDAGGWPVRDTAQRFSDYAALVFAALGDRVQNWTTLNEPWCSSLLGYADGKHAPGRNDPAAALRAVHHLLLGHGLATEAMRANATSDHQFGITLNLAPVDPISDDPAGLDAARRIDGLQNRIFLDPLLRGEYPADVLDDVSHLEALTPQIVWPGDLELISTPIDVLGVNYYTRAVAGTDASLPFPPGSPTPWAGSENVRTATADDAFPASIGERERTGIGWEIYPEGLYETLIRLHREYPGTPVIITENGAAYPDEVAADGGVHDRGRVGYLQQHLAACARAIADGADLRGYFVWSIFDNFEWAEGYAQRFGIVHVDYATQVRTPKDSSAFYSDVIAKNALPQNFELMNDLRAACSTATRGTPVSPFLRLCLRTSGVAVTVWRMSAAYPPGPSGPSGAPGPSGPHFPSPPGQPSFWAPPPPPPARGRTGRMLLAGLAGAALVVVIGVVLVLAGVLHVGSGSDGSGASGSSAIDMPDTLGGYRDITGATKARGASQQVISSQEERYQHTYALTSAAYSKAFGGAGAGVRVYADDELEFMPSVIAIRAHAPGLTNGFVSDPADLGLAVNVQEIVSEGDVQCLVYHQATQAGNTPDPADDTTTSCLRTGKAFSVYVFGGNGGEGSEGRAKMVALTNAAYETLSAR